MDQCRLPFEDVPKLRPKLDGRPATFQKSSIRKSSDGRPSLRRRGFTLILTLVSWVMLVAGDLSLGSPRADELAAQADLRTAMLLQRIKPPVKVWINSEVDKLLQGPSLDPSVVFSDIKDRFFSHPNDVSEIWGTTSPDASAEDLIYLCMVEAIGESDEEINRTLAEAHQPDALNGELSNTTGMKIQTLMDERSKLYSALSNIEKKISNAEGAMNQNLDRPAPTAEGSNVDVVAKPAAGLHPKPDVDVVAKPKFGVPHP